jgi:hypothetical protein
MAKRATSATPETQATITIALMSNSLKTAFSQPSSWTANRI